MEEMERMGAGAVRLHHCPCIARFCAISTRQLNGMAAGSTPSTAAGAGTELPLLRPYEPDSLTLYSGAALRATPPYGLGGGMGWTCLIGFRFSAGVQERWWCVSVRSVNYLGGIWRGLCESIYYMNLKCCSVGNGVVCVRV